MACDAPIYIKYNPPKLDGKGGLIYSFPADCGKCLKCLIKRKSHWAYRISQEQKDSFSAYFVTLTYDDKNLPWGNGKPLLNKGDHKDFIKKLKELEKPKNLALRTEISYEELLRFKAGILEPADARLKYYGVGEYGDTTSRPHWHYLIFNLRDTRNIGRAWSRGIVQVDECNPNTIDYVLKYMIKERPEEWNDEDYQREISFMSKGLGLGAADDQFLRHIAKEDGNLLVNQRGRKIGVPRYYRRKFLDDQTRFKKGLAIARDIEKQEEKRETDLRRQGIDPGTAKQRGKDNRYHLLKNRRQREIK